MDTFSTLQNRAEAQRMICPDWRDLPAMIFTSLDEDDLHTARALHSALVASCPINPSHVINPEALA